MLDMRSGQSHWTYVMLLIVWHPAFLSKLSASGMQSQVHTWLPDFLYYCNQCVALNGILSSPLTVKAGVSQGNVLCPVPFLIFINDLSDALENPLYLFANDSTLCHDITHPSVRQAADSSLSWDLDKISNWSNAWNMSFNPEKSLSKRIVLQTLPSTFSTTLSKKFSHANSCVSLSDMIFLGQATFQSWPPEPDANLVSSAEEDVDNTVVGSGFNI